MDIQSRWCPNNVRDRRYLSRRARRSSASKFHNDLPGRLLEMQTVGRNSGVAARPDRRTEGQDRLSNAHAISAVGGEESFLELLPRHSIVDWQSR